MLYQGNIVINIFGSLILIILYFNSRRNSPYMKQNVLLRLGMLFTIANMMFDSIGWYIDGKEGNIVTILLWIVNVICLILTCFITYIWFWYTYKELGWHKLDHIKWKVIVSIPFAILICISLTTPFTRAFFNIDAENHYVRGRLFALQSILAFAYLVAAGALAYLAAIKTKLKEKRKERICLFYFSIFPFVGGALQVKFYGSAFLWPATALAFLTIYVNITNKYMALDGLTRLNNRGFFDQYLKHKCDHYEHSELHLLLIDLDWFKSINDQYGHTIGDEVLIAFSNVLKKTFEKTDAFLARYGGDEFAVLLSGYSDEKVNELIEKLDKNIVNLHLSSAPEISITASIGHSTYGEIEKEPVSCFISRADEYMYSVKQKRHENDRKFNG